MGYVILLWHSLSLPYNYFECDPVVPGADTNKVVAKFDVTQCKQVTAEQKTSYHVNIASLTET